MNIQEISCNGEWEISRTELVIRKTLGHGSFGQVSKGTWRGTDVALKIICEPDINLSEFKTEMEIMTKIHHPNILQLLGACTLDNPYMIVMEYMINDSLESTNSSLTTNQRIDVMKDVSRGLAYLHNRKPDCIIHRDLKPSNILLSASMKAKIADFGISSLKPVCTENYAMTGETGTYKYMAPEVLTHKKYSAKVDIWSFGIIMYYMFCGDPFKGICVQQLISLILKEIHGLNTKRMPPSVRFVFENTTRFNPDKRWDSLVLVNNCNMMSHVRDDSAPRNCLFFL